MDRTHRGRLAVSPFAEYGYAVCAICGYVDRELAGTEHVAAVRSMMAALAHRGPDAAGSYCDGPAVLGHRRLSVIDLRPEANQPILNEDGTLALVANCEIYNFAELRAELLAKGHRFRSLSDPEVILHLYEEHGIDCVSRLRGMYAFALWDSRRRRLFLARDRVGKKPLYYAARDGNVWFASELSALVGALPWQPRVDYDAIDRYLTLQYVPAPLTAFADVRKLPAAHHLVFEPGGKPRVERYWRLSFAPGPVIALDEAVSRSRALVEEAVAMRQVADVPLGAFLSGGIDSSTVVALLARRSTRPIQTFSVDFPRGDGGEARYARMVAERYSTDHHELVLTPDMVSILPRIVRMYGEPFADPSAVPTYYVSELARRHVVVALSGDAGDEGFGGYGRYGLEEAARRLSRLPHPLPRLVHAAMQRLPGAALRPLREFGAHGGLSPAERYLFFLAHFTHRDKTRIAGPAMLDRAAENVVVQDFARILDASDAKDPLNRLLDLDIQTYLPDDIFTKVDIASMAHALEVRAPFADHVLLEWLASMPGSLKMRGFRGKRILRLAVRDLLPRPILTRRKKGFGLPLGRWMREDLADMSRDLLTDRSARERGVVDPREARRLLDEHQSGVDHGERLWNLTVLELWFRAFVDAPIGRASAARAQAPVVEVAVNRPTPLPSRP
jgi:asparagine synthase (glutamine-hydrolysing)